MPGKDRNKEVIRKQVASVKEQKFYNALKDVFVGAKVEGESGYINLMRIKSRYYENGVFPKLQEDIEKAAEPFPEFKEELFDKLYTFFQRYFSESGSIYFRYTPIHQNVYEKVYTDDKDVILFWKTHMLYYVKTDRLFKNLEVEIPACADASASRDGYKFFFDVSTLEHKRANEKREIIYKFKEKKEDGTLVFNVYYSEKGRKTKIIDILKTLKKEKMEISEDVIERAFRVFEKQSEVDYFINKNAKEFLKEQFNIWLYQYVFSGESDWTEKRIKQLQTLKDIAFKIIDFISQFEDELVKIWNKPKFVLNSNYVITLDRIASAHHSERSEESLKLIEKILKHKNFSEQVKEWKALGIVTDEFRKNKIIENDLTGKHLSKKYKHLPVDTRYFKDLELEILGLFENLDESLDGWLIKSENFQVLSTILPKFNGKVQTIYIDPPYNTGNDDFLYKDNYKHSTWLTMMENRLRVARELMKEEGVIFVSIGDEEIKNLNELMDIVFGTENKISLISRVMKTASDKGNFFAPTIDYILNYAKNIERTPTYKDEVDINLYPKIDKNGRRYRDDVALYQSGLVGERPSRYYIECPNGSKVIPPEGRFWRWTKETFLKNLKAGKIVFKKTNKSPLIDENGNQAKWNIYTISYYDERQERGTRPRNLVTDFINRKGADLLKKLGLSYDYSKPVEMIHYLLKIIQSLPNDIVMDFFAGSGTTAHAVMKLNKDNGGKRKFILIEMANYFDDIIVPRVKKIAFSFNWKEGKPRDSDGIGIFFKYYKLEQYEDTLRKVRYEDADLFDNPYEDPYNQYVFMKDLKMLSALEVDYEQNKVKVDFSKLYPNIDIPETLSNLLGKWIKKITVDYVEFEDGEKIAINNLDYKLIKPLIWW